MARDDDLWADLQTRGLERAKLFSPEIYREKLRTLYAGLT